MFLKRILATIVAVAFTATAQASVQSEMQDWFNDMGGAGNLTPAQTVKGQTSTVYTGGNMYMRTPVRNYQLASVSPPSIRAGCGGIDLFAGSFSFINSEQLTAMLRNIANNAVGYAFMTAVKAVSPDLADLMQYLQDQASKINNLNVNSCQMAEGIVTASASALTDKKEQSSAQGTGSTISNLWPDSFQTLTEWQSTKSAKVNARNQAAAADANLKEILEGGNVVWKALRRSSAPPELKELMMSLIGTVTIVPVGANYGTGKNNANGTKALWVYTGSTGVDFTTFIGRTDASTISDVTLLRCDETSECKNPTTVSNQTVASLAWHVSQTMRKATNNITSRSAQTFTNLDQAVFTNTTIPVWRLATIAAMGNNANSLLSDGYAQTISVDLAYGWFKEMAKTLENALSSNGSMQAADIVDATRELSDRISQVRQLAAQQYMAQYQKAVAMTDMQRTTQWMHETMMRSMPVDFQRSMYTFNR